MCDFFLMIDSHCHLTAAAFDADREEVIARARAGGITAFINIGAGDGIEGNRKAIDFAARHADVFCTVGLHPHDANQFDGQTIALLEEMLRQPKVVGIGEIGLDYHYDFATRENQQAALRAQLALAQRTGLPFIIHNRESETDLLAILREFGDSHRGVIHCFTGDRRQAEAFLQLGVYLSIPGVVTFKNAQALRETLPHIPVDRLLVETDAPYLAPIPYRGKRNEPAFIIQTIETIAAILGKPPADIGSLTAQNTKTLFNLSS